MTNATHPYDALMNITARPQAVFVRGEGAYLWDDAGKRYLDFMQGWAVNCLGHSPPIVAEALAAQAKLLLTPSPAFYNGPSLKLAQALVETAASIRSSSPIPARKPTRAPSSWRGNMAPNTRTVRSKSSPSKAAFTAARSPTMSASGKKAFEPLFEPKVSGFKKATLNDLDSVKALISDNTVAVMLEPIQGEAGVWPATDQFLTELRALTKELGLLLIVDEIQTGMGRTGKLFHYEHAGIEPDIMTLGKGIGGGVPLAALLATAHASCFEHGDQGGTFNGNPLMCAAGLAVLEEVAKPQFLKSATDAGLFLESELQKLSARHGLGEVRGRGLLLALDLKLPIGAAIVAEALADGVLINSPQPDALRFMPALNVTREEISLMIDCLDAILVKAGAARRVA
jgi:acetylornithine/N-succinyldiaminopimelate aminotransferase